MFLQLKHTQLDIFNVSREFVLTSYQVVREFPPEERYAMTAQIRRATLSVHLNIAEGCSRKSPAERKRFYEIARGSLIEVDTALEIAVMLRYTTKEKLAVLGLLIVRIFQLISKMISNP